MGVRRVKNKTVSRTDNMRLTVIIFISYLITPKAMRCLSEQCDALFSALFDHIIRPDARLYFTDVSLFQQEHAES